jgi:alkyl hydroperoxide reductase subunit AhpC
VKKKRKKGGMGEMKINIIEDKDGKLERKYGV